MSMAFERQHRILEILEERSAVTVVELSDILKVSEVTVRKFLSDMESAGLLKRTWGGAVSLSGSHKELEHNQKAVKHVREKRAMAKVALTLIKDGDAIFLDSGSTNLELATAIAAETWESLVIGTNALNIASLLANAPGITVLMTGGEVRGRALSCVGPIAEASISRTFYDKGFISTYRVTPERGITTPDAYEAHFKECLMRICKESIVLADHSKFGDDSMMQVCALGEIDCLITDWLIDPGMLAQAREMVDHVIVADDPDVTVPNDAKSIDMQ